MGEEKAHYAKTRSSDRNYRVFFKDELILESNQALELIEHYDGKDFPTVVYFPEAAVSALLTSKSDHSSYCPIKGEASYLNYRDAIDGIWYYPEPYSQVGLIKNHYGFILGKGFRIEATG